MGKTVINLSFKKRTNNLGAREASEMIEPSSLLVTLVKMKLRPDNISKFDVSKTTCTS